MKEQLTFFTEVLGMELVALYWMHGLEGAWHGFLRLNDQSSVAFVHMPQNDSISPRIGETHAAHGGGPSAPGTMQHLALRVDTLEELLAMRDRIRTHGVPVLGPADHGMCHSIYFAGPENLTLEVACSEEAINPEAWCDPEVVALAGISPEELERMKHPEPFKRPSSPVLQPSYDPERYHMGYPEEVYKKMLSIPDEMMIEQMSFAEPPVKV